ncbi:MAG: preprotein translocase subunit YajC [Candidatus Omnitrophota bacterium]
MLSAYAEAQTGVAAAMGQQANILQSPIVMMVIIFAIFYFILIRPQKKAQDELKTMIAGLKKNDEIITTGGIHGTIMNVKDNSITLKIDDNVKMEIQKNAVGALKKSRQA